ncbi:MAG: phosphatase PAP2 family protein [Proteobacteria bacterium]|nr:phosphatase PAP2 family protein [Pseudomonadota bacterium]
MKTLRPYLWALAACAVLVTLAELFVDRPASTFAHAVLAGHPIFETMQRLPEVLAVAAPIVLVAGGLAHLGRGGLPFWALVPFRAAISLVAAGAIKDALKYAFGHTWPETWINRNPSWIQDGVYGFFPFHGGRGYASFPSGHMTIITAVAGVLWIAWPRLRPLWALGVLNTAVGLYGMDYHFVGDMTAGTFLGSMVAAATWQIAGDPDRRKAG